MGIKPAELLAKKTLEREVIMCFEATKLSAITRSFRGVARSLYDDIYSTCVAPRIVRHRYGSFNLTVRITDRVARNWYDANWPEVPEITFLRERKLKPGARVFEIGAHQGILALQLSKIVTDGSVIAVEAGRHNAEVARENIALNDVHNLTLLEAAIGENDGEVRFSDGLNGHVGNGMVRPCVKIDSLSEKYGVPDVVVLDVEGYEAIAMRGARRTLSSGCDWCVEVHAGGELQSFGHHPEEVVDLFKGLGYSLHYSFAGHEDDIQPLFTIPTTRFSLLATKP